MLPFTCPRCGSVSHSRHDARQGYCGRCHDWTGYAPGGLVHPGERALTPDVLLTSGCFTYEGTEDDGRTTVWRFDPLDGPWVSSWRPDLSMGAFTADWTHNQMRLKVSAEVMARAVMARFPGGDVGESWTWEELRQLVPEPAAALLYACRRCGTEFTVPPEHGEPVLCGFHSPPERMVRAEAPLEWFHAASDPLADLQEARRLIEVASMDFDYSGTVGQIAAGVVTGAQLAAGSIVGDLAGRTVELHGTADQATLDTLGNEIRRGLLPPSTPGWVADAIAVWEGSKDQARRERTLAELAQQVADATPQIRPNQSGTDYDTAASWSASDAGDVIL